MAENNTLDPEKWFNKKRALTCVEALNSCGFTAFYAETKEEAKKVVLDSVPAGASVGVGGSVTVRELDLPKALKARGNTVYDHWDESLSPAEKTRTRNNEITADVFLSSTNALTMKGALVNTDGSGNRVAAMIFGPKISIVVSGYNKIVGSIDEGVARIRKYVAPVNYKRLGREVPCAEGGDCGDCGATKACAITTIIEAKPSAKEKFVVVVVGEKLGY